MSVEIKYKGNTIATASTEVTKTLQTAGKYCEADIIVENTPDGGSVPSSITKIDGGSFTLESDTDARQYSISHNLGVAPTGFLIWTDNVSYGTAESNNILVNLLFKAVEYSATQSAIYSQTRKVTSGTFGGQSGQVLATALNSWATAATCEINIATYYKANATYKWLAWA